jgi:hypothetical protein
MVKLDLPLPLTPVMQVKVPSGILAVTPLRLLARALWTVELLAVALAALGRHLDLRACR